MIGERGAGGAFGAGARASSEAAALTTGPEEAAGAGSLRRKHVLLQHLAATPRANNADRGEIGLGEIFARGG